MGDQLNVQVARDHVGEGLIWLARAEAAYPQGYAVDAAAPAAIAAAHFSAAMAITNILLTDPAEAPEPVEF
jgi:hypothetical protein